MGKLAEIIYSLHQSAVNGCCFNTKCVFNVFV